MLCLLLLALLPVVGKRERVRQRKASVVRDEAMSVTNDCHFVLVLCPQQSVEVTDASLARVRSQLFSCTKLRCCSVKVSGMLAHMPPFIGVLSLQGAIAHRGV